MKTTKRKVLVLAGMAILAVLSVADSGWFTKRDHPIPGHYQQAAYTIRVGGKPLVILGRPISVNGKPVVFGGKRVPMGKAIEYEIKPNGRYTEHHHSRGKWRGPKPNPKWMAPDTVIAIRSDGTYTESKHGTYTLSGDEITFIIPIRKAPQPLTPFERSRLESDPYRFIKDGFEFQKKVARFTKEGFSFFSENPGATRTQVSDYNVYIKIPSN